ncbi:MAG: DUF2892 domain-containing protein [Anaerolineaceae bacterium]|nr:DUF2892 domain-containing protein [Anaerolineaceae bacterium]
MNTKEFYKKLNANPHPIIIDLWAPWCAPCRAMEPAFNQITQKFAGQVDIWKINADESPDVVRALKVLGIPTTIGFNQGEEIIRRTGVQSLESLDLLFDATLHQRSGVILPPAPMDRWIRSFVGLALLIFSWVFGHSLILMALGAVVLFSAFYDRCPIFRAIAPRLIAFFKKPSKQVR